MLGHTFSPLVDTLVKAKTFSPGTLSMTLLVGFLSDVISWQVPKGSMY